MAPAGPFLKPTGPQRGSKDCGLRFLSRVRTRAAGRRSPVLQDQACKPPPVCVRARTPGDCQTGCRATLGTHPEGRAGCVPHRASATLAGGGLAGCGNAAAAAVLCDALDSAVVVGRWSKPCHCTSLRNERGNGTGPSSVARQPSWAGAHGAPHLVIGRWQRVLLCMVLSTLSRPPSSRGVALQGR